MKIERYTKMRRFGGNKKCGIFKEPLNNKAKNKKVFLLRWRGRNNT